MNLNSGEYYAYKLCNWLFHYGIYNMPMPCRTTKHSVANLKTDLTIVNNRDQIFQEIEFLQNDSATFQMTHIISNMTGVTSPPSDVDFSNLYPAIIESFAIIICGYLAGRLNFISQVEGKGLNVFVGTFCLPSLIFMSMAKLDFSSVNWLFLSSICISKTIVFFLVLFITVLVYRPVSFGRAGLYAIFCTQSNDFALGYPIIAALYEKVHPEFASYLYLIAPISFVFLNPIGYILMEVEKRKNASHSGNASTTECSLAHNRQNNSKIMLVISFILELVKNPFIFMTVLGIGANFLFRQELPDILEGVLKVFGNAFSASALFLLGLSMVGKVQNLKGSGLVAPGILIAVKTLVLPLVTRETISLLKPGITTNETEDFSNYGFLYGTFPTAPGVFVFAAKYDIAVDMIASSMVACTFLSAPLMFISAKMVTLVSVNPADYLRELEHFFFNVSIIGLICSSWVCIVFCLSRKWRKVPHFITLCLAISQSIACIGALLWSTIGPDGTWKSSLQFIVFSYGIFSTRIWTSVLAVTLFFLRWRSLEFVLRLRPYMAAIGWSVPGALVFFLVMLSRRNPESSEQEDPNFQYGSSQAIVALLVLWFSLFTTMVCLILHQRYEKRYSRFDSMNHAGSIPAAGSDGSESPGSIRSNSPLGNLPPCSRPFLNEELDCTIVGMGSPANHCDIPNGQVDNVLNFQSDEDSLFSYSDQPSSHRSLLRDRTVGLHGSQTMGSSTHLTEPAEVSILRDRDDEHQMLRHVVLLLFLCGSMIVGFSLCMWALVTPLVNGVYVELVFLDVVLNFGQGMFTAVIFGLDVKWMFVPMAKWWRYIVYGTPNINLPSVDKLDHETRQVCEQFTTYHMDKCVKDIVRDRSWRMRDVPSSFAGHELVDWLLMVGLAHDRTDAVKYGRMLLQGRIIRHTENLHHFHDQPLFYTFVCARDASLLPAYADYDSHNA